MVAGHDPHTSDRALATLRQRCATLGLHPFLLDDAGRIVSRPHLSPTISTLLGEPGILSTLSQLAQSASPKSSASVRKLTNNAFAIHKAAQRHGRTVCLIAIACLQQPSTTTHAAGEQESLVLQERDLPLLQRSVGCMIDDLVRCWDDEQTLDRFGQELMQSYEQISLLFRLARLLNCADSPADVVGMVARQIQAMLPYSWVAICFGESATVLPSLSGTLVIAGRITGDEPSARAQIRRAVDQCDADRWTTILEPDQHPLASITQTQIVAEPITHDSKAIGLLLAGGKKGDDPDAHSSELQFLDATAAFLGVYHENAARFHEQRMMFLGTLRAMTAAIDAKDPYTRGHSERVALLGRAIAEACGLSPQRVEEVYVAGLVHDVGKIGVPEAVLCKAGKLNDDEFALIRAHPRVGFNILEGIPPLAPMLPGVLSHHERWDGRGYPDKLAGDDIPIYGRILALADSFDAMSSNRAYRAALPRAQVLAEIQRCAGTQFDPDLVHLFASIDLTEFDRLLSEHKQIAGRAA